MEANIGNTFVCQAASVGNCRQKKAVLVTNLKDFSFWGKEKYLADGDIFVLPLN